jgi:transmembrane sensor
MCMVEATTMSLRSRVKLLHLFLQGKTSARQNSLIDTWYQSVADTPSLTLWEEAGKKEATREALRLGIMEHVQPRPKRVIAMSTRGRWMAAASTILVLLTTGWLISRHHLFPQPVQYFTVTAPLGKVRQLLLSDSSVIWLKSGSTLQYTSTYGKDKRELALLNGEAFFKVQKDDDHPFIVKTNQLETRVLGTSFNIQAYAGRPNVQVWVASGRVQVSENGKVLRELTKHMRLQWNRSDKAFACDSLQWQSALLWKQGIMLLESASFSELAIQLKEIYGVELVTGNRAISKQRYDAKFFIHTPVEDIAATLAEVHGIRYKKEGNRIRFY